VKGSRSVFLAGAAWLGFLSSGCDNMKHQENVRAFDPSQQFADGASARNPPAHTVARGDPAPDDPATTGVGHGEWLGAVPISFDRALLARGRDRFNIFCSDCHGEDGYGTGIVVRRGFPQPASFHDPRLRAEAAGKLFDAISKGTGVMYGFGDRITPHDRWAIVAYIRALQKSQRTSVSELSADDRQRLAPP
jgi:mono/diheme cytochrome c family protein